jgi:predicted nucleotide-binding protein
LSLPKYHIYIEYTEPDKSGIRFNIGQEELNRTFAEPFNAGQSFWFLGRLLTSIKVVKAVLFWSYEPADKLKLPNGENLVVTKDKKFLIDCIQKSKVKGAYICTEKFLTQKNNNTTNQSSDNTHRRVFVISGSDEEMKKAVTKALTKLLLVPIILCEDPVHCRKIIEQSKDYVDVNFAVALLSPDDYAYAKTYEPTKRRLRPQQEAIFELGFLLGKLSKDKVLILFREAENFEVPTNFAGLKVTAFDDRDSWKLALVRELANNGYSIEGDRILK